MGQSAQDVIVDAQEFRCVVLEVVPAYLVAEAHTAQPSKFSQHALAQRSSCRIRPGET